MVQFKDKNTDHGHFELVHEGKKVPFDLVGHIDLVVYYTMYKRLRLSCS